MWQIKKLGEIRQIKKDKNPSFQKTQEEGFSPYLGAKFLRGKKEVREYHDLLLKYEI